MTTSSAAPVERATWTCRWLGDLKHRTWTLVSVSFSFHGWRALYSLEAITVAINARVQLSLPIELFGHSHK